MGDDREEKHPGRLRRACLYYRIFYSLVHEKNHLNPDSADVISGAIISSYDIQPPPPI